MLADIRSKGYAIDRGELREGVHCVAVPLREHDGTAVAAISVTGYALEDATWEDRAVDVLVKVASDASRELFQGP
jgi:IclR family acetate operon transcriptional repressor